MIYSDDTQLIPRGTTVQVKRVPLPRGEKKTWRVERESRDKRELSNVEVTSTSEEGRMDQVIVDVIENDDDFNNDFLQVLAVSGQEYGKDNWERIWRPKGPRPLAGESVAPEKRYAHGIPSSMLVTASEGDNTAAKLDKFGQLKLTAVEREGYGQEKVESHDWLKEDDDSNSATATVAAEEEVSLVPKDLQCPFCMDILSAAVLLPCCVAAACDECARNMLVESDLKCSLCFEDNISPDHLIPNPHLRKKVAEFKNKGKEETRIKLQPLPKLLSGNRVLPAEIMLQRQKEEEEEKKKIEEKKLVDAVLANINDNDPSPDNLPIADTPTEMDDIDHAVGDHEDANVESTAIQSPQAQQEDTNDSISRPSSGLDQQPSSPAEISQDRIQSKSASPMVQSQSSPASTLAAPVPDSTARFMGSLQEMTDTSGASGARPNKKDVKINDSGDIRTRSNFEEVQSFNPSLILPTDACYDIYKQRKNSKVRLL